MKKTFGSIVTIIIIIFVTWQVQANFYPTVVDRTVTDTTYVEKPYPVEVIEEKEVPVEVTRWKTKVDTIESVKLVTDTVYVSTSDNQYTYHSSFLTQYSSAHKFLGLTYRSGDLELTTLSPQGITDTNIWDVGERNYEVGVNIGLRTSQKAFSSQYTASAGWIQWVDQGSFYLQGSGNFRIFGVNTQTTININKQPFITAGVTYDFNQ